MRIAVTSVGIVFAGGVLTRGQDDIRPEKDLVEIPAPPNLWAWMIGIVLLIVALLLVHRILKRKRPVALVSAADKALRKLDEAERHLGTESPEPLANEVTSVIRHYIEERFSLAAPRRTTEEFLRELKDATTLEIGRYRGELNDFLHACDRIKFGRGNLESEDRRALLDSARKLIEETRRANREGGAAP